MQILLVDDDADILDAVSVGLRFHWRECSVLTAQTGGQGLRLFYENTPDLVVLDVNMPDRSGFDVLQEIRRVSDVPVIMLTALSNETSQVRGLDLGADDYVAKPFSIMALLARMRSVMRRTDQLAGARAKADTTVGDLSVDFDNQQVWVRGQQVMLTPTEFRLLSQLARNPRRVIPSRVLRERIWGAEWEATANDLKALVSRLRSKLGDDPRQPRYIETQRGLGYRLLGKPAAGDGETPERDAS